MSQKRLDELDEIVEELLIFQGIDGIKGNLSGKIKDHLNSINYNVMSWIESDYIFYKIRQHYLPDPFRADTIKQLREMVLNIHATVI